MDFLNHRSLAPMMWALFGLMSLEMCVLHFLLFLSIPWVATVVSCISLGAILWVGVIIYSFKRMPVRIVDGRLILHAGRLRSLSVDLSNVAGIRESWDREALNVHALLNLALISWPNIVIDFKIPVRSAGKFGAREILSVAHRLDNPTAFIAALPYKRDRLIRG